MGIIISGDNINATLIDVATEERYELPLNETYKIEGNFLLNIVAIKPYHIIGISYWDSGEYVEENISEDCLEYDMYVTLSGYNQQYDIVTKAYQPPETVSGFNNLYLVDNEILKSLTKERFIINGAGSNDQIIDLGEFIINIWELPFPVPLENIGNKTPIMLATYSMKTESPKVLNDEILIDMGSIIVPSKFSNSFDYVNTKTVIHLPFVESVEIEPIYVINSIINVTYIINLYTGNVTVNIYSSKTGTVIESKNFTLGRNLPYVTANKVVGEMKHSEGLNNGIRKMYIEVSRNEPLEMNQFNVDVLSYSTLEDVNGYIEVTNIELQCNATLNEKNRIISILNNGIYIK